VSLVQYAALVLQWLGLSVEFRKLPVEGAVRRDLSVQKSQAGRRYAVQRLKERLALAREMIDDLATLRPGNETIEGVFRSLALRMMCLEIKAALLAERKMAAVSVSRAEKEQMLRDIATVRLAPDFRHRSTSDQQLVWQVEGELRGELGETERLRIALREQRRLTTEDPDARARLLVELMRAADHDEEKVALLGELTALAETSSTGPIFSTERIGRISILRDAMWAMASSVGIDSTYAPLAVDQAFLCYGTWMFGAASAPATNTVRLVASWSGRGRVMWESEGRAHVADFSMDPVLESTFFAAMEGLSSRRQRATSGILKMLDTDLAPALNDAIAARGEVRLHVGGSAAILPLLMTQVGDRPLGADPRIAYAHPNPQVASRSARSDPIELLVIDDIFSESRDVRVAHRLAAENTLAPCRILRFDSGQGGFDLSSDEFGAALEDVSTAAIFCHVDAPMMYAGETSIVTGPTSRYRVDALAALDLGRLDEFVVIGCASGRSNPFVGGATVAHAGAMAGAHQVLFTMWPVWAKHGAGFLRGLIEARSQGIATAGYLATAYERDRTRAGDFAITRPAKAEGVSAAPEEDKHL
jgi:hypothetical protein